VGRIGRGWVLTKESWAVVRGDRSLLLFPIVTGVSALAVAAVFFGVGAGVGTAADSFWAALPFLVLGAYLIIAIGQFCAVALAACATKALDGADTRFSDGVGAARVRLGVILAWAGVQLLVGAAITALQALLRDAAGGLVSGLVGGVANFAWTVATFFVVPVIALEGAGPRDAIKRSSGVVRERWGEGVVGTATIGGAIFLAGILPGVLLIAIGAALTADSAAAGAVLIAVGVIVVVIAPAPGDARGGVSCRSLPLRDDGRDRRPFHGRLTRRRVPPEERPERAHLSARLDAFRPCERGLPERMRRHGALRTDRRPGLRAVSRRPGCAVAACAAWPHAFRACFE
jgi:hypothetical protein